jgi:zinc transporter 1/2/3
LLTPAFEALGSECLSGGWTEYVSRIARVLDLVSSLTSALRLVHQDWAPAIAMMSVYAIFFAEVAAYRIGNKRMEKLGMTYNTHADAEAEHGHSHAHENLNNGNALDESISPVGSSEEGVAGVNVGAGSKAKMAEAGFASSDSLDADAARTDYDISTSEGVAQLIAVAVLEFGVILHSIVIGLTLALSDEFVTLFIVIIFHRTSLWSFRSDI